MRAIKFRAWDKEKNRWVNHNEWLELTKVSASVIAPSILSISHPNWIIQQFTGLKDKNGKEIYEGDILKRRQSEIPEWHLKNSTMLLEVKWDEKYCNFYLQRINEYGEGPFNPEGKWGMNTSDCDEVIGDIYSTPNLLKEASV